MNYYFQEKCLLIRYQLLWAESNWPIKILKDWKRNKNIVFNSKKYKVVLLMAVRLSLWKMLRRLRRMLMKSRLHQMILLVDICWPRCPMCSDNNVKGCEPLLDIMGSFRTCLGKHLIVHRIMPFKLLWIAAWKIDLKLIVLMTELQTFEGMIKSKVRRGKYRSC